MKRLLPASAAVLLLAVLGVGASSAARSDSGGSAAATEKTLLILHTNDIHDRLRADYDGNGGLPFIAGFIQDVRHSRDDVLVLDAGDVAEKGDLVARRTGSDLVFEAMGRVGYHAWAPGNHDHDFGIEALHRFTELAGMDILCINLFKEDGSLEFAPSNVYTIDGVRVGVIGAIAPRSERSLDLQGTAEAMGREAARLRPSTDLVVALIHIGARDAQFISGLAPDIDVFITGHSHELLSEPVQTPSGALVVQTGSYAENVGWLELRLDLPGRRVLSHDYRVVPMEHTSVRPDLAMLEWIRLKELELAPEALEVVSWSPRVISYLEVGILAAEGLRRAYGADVALNHTASVVRAPLPAGVLDWNAIYRTGGERGNALVEVELTGEEVESYVRGMSTSEWLPTQWAGFHASGSGAEFVTDLVPGRTYTVVMPLREWETRFLRLFERVMEDPSAFPGVEPLRRTPTVTEAEGWTEAVVALLKEWEAGDQTLDRGIAELARVTGQTIPEVTGADALELSHQH